MDRTAFSIGTIDCRVVSDGNNFSPPDLVFANASPDERAQAVKDLLDERGQLVTPYNCLLARVDGKNVLIDAGAGDLAREVGFPAGRLFASLEAAGQRADDIDVVIVSHGHPDHIGGLTRNDGAERRPVFRRARHYFSRTEWDSWTSSAFLAQLPEMFASPARIHLPVLEKAGLVHLVEGEEEVLDGVRIVPAPGHTPGHVAVALASQGESAIFIADAVLHELNFEYPHWISRIDAMPELTVETRRRLLEEAARQQHLLVGFHLQTPGRVRRTDSAFAFNTLEVVST